MNLARSSFYLTGTNIGISGLTAIGFFFLAIVLSPEQLGILSLLVTIPSVGQNLLSFSYNRAAIYFLGRKTFSLEEIITNGVVICAVLAVMLVAIVFLLAKTFGLVFPKVSLEIIYLASISIPLQILMFYLTEACIAAEQLFITILAKIISPAFYVIACGLVGLRGSLNGELAFVFYVIGISLSNLVGITLLIVRSQHKRLFKPNVSAAVSCLKFGGMAQIGELAQYLALRLDLILVGVWVGVEASGYYSVAVRIAEVFWLAAYSLQLVFSAKVAHEFHASISEKGKRLGQVVRYVIAGSSLGGIVVIGASFLIFKLMLTQYEAALVLLVVLTPGQIALAIFLILTGNLMGDGATALATKLRLIFFFFSVVLYCALIPVLNEMGAALATTVSYIISTIIAAVLLARMYQIRLRDFVVWKEEDRQILIVSRQYWRRYFAA